MGRVGVQYGVVTFFRPLGGVERRWYVGGTPVGFPECTDPPNQRYIP